MTKKNTYLVMLLVLLFIACLGTGIYFLLQPKNSETISYNVNRYEDLTNWCDTNTVDDKLNLDCKALLLEIRIIDTNNSCTDIQVITKENELKNISICEKNEEITFSNDVLGYKRLMPIDLALTYTKDNTTNKYSLETTTVSKLDDAYIQSIVIKDISSLISTTIDRTFTEKTVENGSKYLSANEDTYTITNSIDYCPAPEILPNYITNKDGYTQFYKKNILTNKDYSNISEDQFFAEIFEKLFSCDSSNKLGYGTCNLSKISNLPVIATSLEALNTDKIVWGTEIDLMSRIYLKQISAIYDNMYANKEIETQYIIDLNKLISDINTKKELSETTFCASYKLFDSLSIKNSQFDEKKNFIKSMVITNLDKVTSSQCLDIFTKSEIDLQGAYLKVYFSNMSNKSIFRIYNQCNNLSSIIN